MTLEMMKERQKELNYSNDKLALLTETPRSTFYRRWNGDGENLPHDFITKCCFVLGLSIDEDERTPTATSPINLDITEQEHEEIMRIFAERLNEKQDQIDTLTAQNAELQDKVQESHALFHELNHKHIERIDRLNAESKEREDRKNAIIRKQFQIITILSVFVALLTAFSLYFVIDAFNGQWGIVRYEDGHLELVPRVQSDQTEQYSDEIEEDQYNWYSELKL